MHTNMAAMHTDGSATGSSWGQLYQATSKPDQ